MHCGRKKRAQNLFYQLTGGCLFLLFFLGLSACGGGGSGADEIPVVSTSCNSPAYVTGSVGGGLIPAAVTVLPGDSLETLSRAVSSSAAKTQVIIQVRKGISCADLAARYTGLTFKRKMRGGFCLFESRLSAEETSALKSDPDVRSFELNRKLRRHANDPYAAIDWAMIQTDAPDLLDLGEYPIENVVIAVLDSGIRYHEDLPAPGSPLWVRGYDFVTDSAAAGDGDGHDADPTDVGSDDFSHGTGMTGIIGGIWDNGLGSFGAAAGVKIMPVRVVGLDNGTISDIVEGLYYAAGLPNLSGTVPPVKADIINISLGTDSASPLLHAAITDVRNNGVIIVASVGNDGIDAVSYPAAFSEVIGVGATDINDILAPYSNYGDGITLVAGAGDLEAGNNWSDGKLILLGTDEYGLADGTSVAAPLVAASLGWLKAACSFLTPLDVDELIAGIHPDTAVEITTDLGASGYDPFYGYGLLATVAGVEAAEEVCNAVYLPPQPEASTTALTLTSAVTSGSIEITNSGGGELVVTEVNYDDTFLSLEVVDNGAGGYTLTATLLPGFSGQLDMPVDVYFSGIADPVRVTFEAAVGAFAVVTTSVVTLQLKDAQTDTLAFSAYSDPDREQTYSFPAVEPGSYNLVAGLDLNDNGILCEEGEPCSDPIAIDVACGDVTASVNIEIP